MKQIFTFGSGQKHEGCYIVIFGKTKAKCRQRMFRRFGSEWAFQYDSEEEAGVEKYNLERIL